MSQQQPLQYRTCRHLSADGRPCGSPALRGEYFCYYHHRDRQRQKLMSAHNARRFPRLTPSLLDALQLPAPDDPAGIRVCIATLMRGILSGLIDREQAGQVLYLIQLATVNNRHAVTDFDPEAADVHAITDPEPIRLPAADADSADRFASAVLDRDSRNEVLDCHPERGTKELATEDKSRDIASASAASSDSLDSRSLDGYANLEVVMVCPRDEAHTNLTPTDALRPATLDAFDLLRTTPPAPPAENADEAAFEDLDAQGELQVT